MEQVTVKELASEFELKSTVVITELKKIGVWVPSSGTLVDSDIANRIRKRLQMMLEAEQEDKKPEKAKKTSPVKSKRSIKDLGTPRKRSAARKAEEEAEKEPVTESPLVASMSPRKGRKSTYLKMEALKEEQAPLKPEVSIDEAPVIEAVQPEVPLEAAEAARAALEEEMAEAIAVGEIEEAEARETAEVAQEAEAPAEAAAAEAAVEEEPEVEAAVETVAETPEAEAAAGAEAVAQAPEVPAVPKVVRPVPSKEPKQPQRVKSAVARKKKQKLEREKERAKPAPIGDQEVAAGPREVFFSEKVTVKTFTELTGIKSNEIIRLLMQKGVMATMNQLLDQGTIETLCEKFEIVPQFGTFEEAAALEFRAEERPEDLEGRAPVVTVMGHVDHGKTTLLDFIRKTRVADGEAGGITQHIGAYDVWTNGKKIVFIDTPGHEAFTRMRARGAQATDIVVLVVAADDGVMPQTLEAMDHARAAEVPILVAINKIDKPGCQPDRIKQQLSDRGLVSEDWGGDTIMVPVSAKEGTNVDQLLEMILLVAEVQELKANPKRTGSGVILEAKMEKGRGTVATALVQDGTLRIGDTFIAGSAYGKVRAMFNDKGDSVSEVGPSSAVEVLGLQGIPLAGDVFQVVDDASRAREMVEFRQERQREQDLAKTAKVSLDDLYAQLQAGEVKELGVVLKGDTQGSVEVLEDTLTKLSTEKVRIVVVLKGVGAINESDVDLASASRAIVIGFNVRPEPNARTLAERNDVEIRLYNVIYDVAQEIEKAMVGLLSPTIQERYLGRAEVRDTFRIPKVGVVAGSYVQDGALSRNSHVRLLRDNVVIYEGRLSSLKRFKEDVGEVKSGYECGIGIANFNDIKVGDVIEAFTREEVAPQLT